MNALLTLKIISPKIKKNTRNSQFNYENKIVKIQTFAQFYKMNTSFYLYENTKRKLLDFIIIYSKTF